MTNAEVRDVGLEIAEGTGLPYTESRAFFDGGRFAYVVDFGDVTEDVGLAGEPDPVGLSLVLRSSYDQSWRFEAALMGKRFACDNGLLSGEFFARVSFKHTSGSEAEDWREVVRQGMRLVHRAPMTSRASAPRSGGSARRRPPTSGSARRGRSSRSSATASWARSPGATSSTRSRRSTGSCRRGRRCSGTTRSRRRRRGRTTTRS